MSRSKTSKASKSSTKKPRAAGTGTGTKEPWTLPAVRELHRMSEKKLAVKEIATKLGRTAGAVRQKARQEGLSLGVHQRRVATADRKRAAQKACGYSHATA